MIRMTFATAVAASFLFLTRPGLAQNTPEASVRTETFQSWRLTCVATDDRQACEINQNVADQSGRPVMQLMVGRFGADGPDVSMLARFPANITTTMPIVWSAGETSIVLMLKACLNAICTASGPISGEVVTALLRADPQAQTRFTMTQADGASLSVPLSLTGFADAWNAMAAGTR